MLYAIVAVIILIIDQAVKYWTTLNIALNSEHTILIPGIIGLTNIHNDGAAFGIFPDARWFFVVLTLIFTVVIIVLLNKNIITGKLGRWMLVMVMAGGLGNCIDRILNGYVVDMFQFQFTNFAVFNVADICITCCGILFCVYLIFHKESKEVPAKVPERATSRRLPAENARPIKNTDYISQLRKPVVDGRASIEAEIAAKRSENQSVCKVDSTISDWNMPEFEGLNSKSPSVSPASLPKQDLTVQKRPELKPTSSGESFEELSKKPEQPAKKKDTEFSLEDIIAEFKD